MNQRTRAKIYNRNIIAGQIRTRNSGQTAMVITDADGRFNAVDMMFGKIVFDEWLAAADTVTIRNRYPQVLKEPRELRWT